MFANNIFMLREIKFNNNTNNRQQNQNQDIIINTLREKQIFYCIFPASILFLTPLSCLDNGKKMKDGREDGKEKVGKVGKEGKDKRKDGKGGKLKS